MTVDIRIGHVLDRLAEMPDESVHCVWTSVPYWGLRSYKTEPQVWPTGWRGEHGLEPSFELWLEHEVIIFKEVRRVMRSEATLWLNIGDAYASSVNGTSAAETKAKGEDDRTFRDKPLNTATGVFKPKDRLMMPARLVIALQERVGFWLRDEIVWRKPNPMPSSVRDRTTPAHEMLYLLSKSARYFYDGYAIMEPCSPDTHARVSLKMPDNWDTGGGRSRVIPPTGPREGQDNVLRPAAGNVCNHAPPPRSPSRTNLASASTAGSTPATSGFPPWLTGSTPRRGGRA